MFHQYPKWIFVLVGILFCAFMYRIGLSELTPMEFGLYTALFLIAVFLRDKTK